MKIFYALLGLVMQTTLAQATVLPKEQPRETAVYTFSDELIGAIENCADYKTEFSIKETPYAHLGDFAEDMPAKSEFEIYKKDENMCRMRVRLVALGKGETRFNCRLNDKQREMLVRAMRDKSTEEYVITLPTENEADCSGCSSAITFSGNLFDTTLAMLKPQVCAELHIQPTKEDIAAARAYKQRFTKNFRKALHECVPIKDKKALNNMLSDIEIIGKSEDDKCRLKYMNFEISIFLREAKTLSSADELQRILVRDFDAVKYDYKAQYDENGLLFGLDACRKQDGFYDAGENIFMRGNIQERNGLYAKRVRETCQVVLRNTLQVANIYQRDYSMQCNVPVFQIDSFIVLYKHLLEENGAQTDKDKNGISYTSEVRYTPEMRKADSEIMAKIREAGYCFMKLPIDPIKLDVDDFMYHNSLPTK